MSQHDYVVGNQTFPNTRQDLNNALQALASLNAGASEPSAPFANMLWTDTANDVLKIRNEANDAWITIGTLDQAGGMFRLVAGAAANIIASQAQAEARGDNSVLMTPLRVEQLMTARAGAVFGSGGNESALGTTASMRLSVPFTVTATRMIANATMHIAKSGVDVQDYYLDLRLYNTPAATLVSNVISRASANENYNAACRIDASLATAGLTNGQAHRLEIWSYQGAATGAAYPSGMTISGLMI